MNIERALLIFQNPDAFYKREIAEAMAAAAMIIERQKEEIAALKRDMLLAQDHETIEAFCLAWGLTPREAMFLSVLCGAAGRGVSRDQMMSAMYSDVDTEPSIKIVDIWLCKLRRKLPVPGMIARERGVQGPMFLTPVGKAECAAVLERLRAA